MFVYYLKKHKKHKKQQFCLNIYTKILNIKTFLKVGDYSCKNIITSPVTTSFSLSSCGGGTNDNNRSNLTGV